MMKKIWKQLKNRKGFTLIELIVVIAVLGILAAVALPRIGNVTERAKESADAQELRMLNEALERYIAETGDSELNNFTPEVGTGSASEKAKNVIAALKNEYSVKVGSENSSVGPFIENAVDETLPSGGTIYYDSVNQRFTDKDPSSS